MCILLSCVSAFPFQGIPSDQTHQCRDFLLQGSTIQQTWGKKELYFVIYNKYSAFVNIPPVTFAQFRTRSSLLESLQTELSTRSQCMVGNPLLSALTSSEGVRVSSEGSGGFIENFKAGVILQWLTLWTLCMYFNSFSSKLLFYREPSVCGATRLRLLVYPRRSVEVHYIDQR